MNKGWLIWRLHDSPSFHFPDFKQFSNKGMFTKVIKLFSSKYLHPKMVLVLIVLEVLHFWIMDQN